MPPERYDEYIWKDSEIKGIIMQVPQVGSTYEFASSAVYQVCVYCILHIVLMRYCA